MSNSDHLEWCLREGQIELDSPNQMLAEDYQAKAREALEVSALLENNEHYDWSVTASYYARYFILTALLRKCGVVAENHACAITLFEVAFVEEGELDEKLLESIKEGKRSRVEKQYGITRTTDTTAENQREKAVNFVTELNGYIEGISSDMVEQVRRVVEKM
ncbi:MAG: HEPN domain-containing protein [Candidatus Paceibacterota bacterium]